MSCKKYIAAILLCSVLLAGCSGFPGGERTHGERNPRHPEEAARRGRPYRLCPKRLRVNWLRYKVRTR